MRDKSYPAKLFFFSILFIQIVMPNKNEVPVGVVLDFDDTIGKIGLSCINISLSHFYAKHSHYKTRLLLHARDSNRDVVAAAAAGYYSFISFVFFLNIYILVRRINMLIE